MNDANIGKWVSRIIRWALAAGFTWIACQYSDLWFFYLFAITALITSFMIPKRCIDGVCPTDDKR